MWCTIIIVDNNTPFATEIAAETIGSCGGIQDILAAMRAYPGNADLMSACCNALWSLTVNGMRNLDFDCITITCIIGLYRLFLISVNREGERGLLQILELRQSMQDYDTITRNWPKISRIILLGLLLHCILVLALNVENFYLIWKLQVNNCQPNTSHPL